MRILLAGEWRYECYEEALAGGWRRLGHEVRRFCWRDWWRPRLVSGGRADLLGGAADFARRVEEKFLLGPHVIRANLAFRRKVEQVRPDVVFVFRGTHLFGPTLAEVRRRWGIPLVGYNQDDPFGVGHPFYLWRHFRQGIPHYDLLFAYRHRNLEDFRRAGARSVALLRSWFIPERDRPLPLNEADRQRFGCDVTFVGHHEDDGRVDCLADIVRAGWRLRVFGMPKAWEPVLRPHPVLRALPPVVWVRDDDYAKALCGAKIALCFLSKKNGDTYTRRCFEIPATRSFLLSEYSDDQASLFEEGREAEFFRSREELLAKITWYLEHAERRAAVAEAGYQRVYRDGHDVVSRARQACSLMTSLLGGAGAGTLGGDGGAP